MRRGRFRAALRCCPRRDPGVAVGAFFAMFVATRNDRRMGGRRCRLCPLLTSRAARARSGREILWLCGPAQRVSRDTLRGQVSEVSATRTEETFHEMAVKSLNPAPCPAGTRHGFAGKSGGTRRA